MDQTEATPPHGITVVRRALDDAVVIQLDPPEHLPPLTPLGTGHLILHGLESLAENNLFMTSASPLAAASADHLVLVGTFATPCAAEDLAPLADRAGRPGATVTLLAPRAHLDAALDTVAALPPPFALRDVTSEDAWCRLTTQAKVADVSPARAGEDAPLGAVHVAGLHAGARIARGDYDAVRAERDAAIAAADRLRLAPHADEPADAAQLRAENARLSAQLARVTRRYDSLSRSKLGSLTLRIWELRRGRRAQALTSGGTR